MAVQSKSKVVSKATPTQEKKKEPTSSKVLVPKSAVKKEPEVKRAEYALSGELTIVSGPVPPISSETKSFSTFGATMDSKGQLFVQASLEVTVNDKRSIVVLSSRQVKAVLNAVGIVPYANI